MVLNLWRTVVVAAGNNGLTNGNVLSPALAYNVIAVGNFDDRRTVAWADDVMNPTSSFRDPISWIGDRQKPEVAAPGTDITSTTTVAPWIGVIGSGTSFAAPMVTGGAALLIQRNGFFSVWPESVKALLMVTAVHNIEGATRLSDRDGAGGIVLDRADDVAGGVTGGSSGQGYNCAAPVNTNIAVVRLAGGILTRVAIVWDNDPTYVNYVTRPSADLDLQVIDPNGFVAAQSLSWDNTYEIVEFTPPANGNYTLRVNKFRCNQTPKWLGWAWRQGN
jgi:subtilisin family serine protease